MMFIPNVTAAALRENTSALPNAPQVLDDDVAASTAVVVRARLAEALRATARTEERLANRLDPACGIA